jgi:DNA-binding Lrp family transcriptional regulator
MSKNPALDRIDFEILRALTKDARMSNKQIAAAVGLAQSTCLERIRSLRARGVLRGAHAEVDLAALGVGFEALLMVQLAKLGRDQVDRFVRSTAAVREVRRVFLVSGRHDLIVHVAVASMERLKQLISDRFNRHACVLRVETSMVFDHHAHHELPVPA